MTLFPNNNGYNGRNVDAVSLSLLDEFAKVALQGLLAAESEDYGHYHPVYESPTGIQGSYKGPSDNPFKLIVTAEQNITARAYLLANAMLLEREKHITK